MLTYDELRYVDERLRRTARTRSWDIDNKLATEVVAWARRPGPGFLFVEKIGLHVPYERNLPAGISAGAGRAARAWGGKTRRRTRGRHRQELRGRGIRLRVDDFFRRLLPTLTRPGTLLIYTSDHGQSLYDGPYDAGNCTGPGAVEGQGMVPLVVFASDADTRLQFQDAARALAETGDPTATSFRRCSGRWGSTRRRDSLATRAAGLDTPPSHRVRRFFVLSPFAERLNWVHVD